MTYVCNEGAAPVEEVVDRCERSIEESVVRDTLQSISELGWIDLQPEAESVWNAESVVWVGKKGEVVDSGTEGGTSEEADNAGQEEKDLGERVDATPLDEVRAETPSGVPEDRVFRWTVDRISGGGNVVVELPGGKGELNLGPIDSDAVGEEVVFRTMTALWGTCLTDKYTYEEYEPSDGRNQSKGSNRVTGASNPSKGSSGNNPVKRSKSISSKGSRNRNNLLNDHQ
jgi:hypothetical protein